MMDYFVIGDIHGCFYTFREMLKNWNKEKEHLICVGDLIDRGNHSAMVVQECMQLTEIYQNVTIIKGNHEAEIIEYYEKGALEHWIVQGGKQTLENLEQHQVRLSVVIPWFEGLPLKFEQDHLFVSHAGLSNTLRPFEEENQDGVLWNRKPLKNIGKIQVHGHTPLRSSSPQYTAESESWNIDTGAAYGYGLTGLKISFDGKVSDVIFIKTLEKDVRII
ncbi:metallophosphoesterase [Pedobacter antarcticus]|uniref:metallophosphoesterase n=1 Tax=Pedobacter antarcticus TaxID=34086 RepID=UPI001C40A981